MAAPGFSLRWSGGAPDGPQGRGIRPQGHGGYGWRSDGRRRGGCDVFGCQLRPRQGAQLQGGQLRPVECHPWAGGAVHGARARAAQ
eukprot:6864050-Lingulodinium_polyedra.AAC.1